MSVETRIDYFASILMFETVQGTGLHYLSVHLTYTHLYHSYNTRAASNNVLVSNRPNCKIFKTLVNWRCMFFTLVLLWHKFL